MKKILEQPISRRFKSPITKLVRFFEESRDNWKQRAKESKYKIKLLNKKIKYLEQTKIILKKQIKQLEKKLEKSSYKEKQDIEDG
jgi:uncharacterized protein YlxW (UPF0749 family)